MTCGRYYTLFMMERKRPKEKENGKKEKLAKTDLIWLVECICRNYSLITGGGGCMLNYF